MRAVAAMYPSQYRKYMLAWKEAYADNPEYFNDSGFRWLAKHAKRVGGSYKISNGMIFRVFFPIYVKPDLPGAMLDVFADANYVIDDSAQVVTDRHGRHISAGKAYQQLAKKSGVPEKKIKSVLETYAEALGSSGAMMLCVSRHPYDIAGMSTGRAWKSCHTVGGTTPRDKQIYAQQKAQYARMMLDHGAELEAKYAELSEEYRNQKIAYVQAVSDWESELKALVDVLSNAANGIVDRVLSDEIIQVLKGFNITDRAKVLSLFVSAVQTTLSVMGSAVVALQIREELSRDESDHVIKYLPIAPDAHLYGYTKSFSDALQALDPDESFNWVILRKVAELLLNGARQTCKRIQPELMSSLTQCARSLADTDSSMRSAARARDDLGVKLSEPELNVEPAGEKVSYVQQDVITGSVIAYVIKPRGELLTSLERTKRIAPNLAELLEKKFNRSNNDPLFAPLARVILRSANRRYLRAGTVYGFSELPDVQRQFGVMVHTLTVALNKARKRDYGILEPLVHEYNDAVDTTYSEGDTRGSAKIDARSVVSQYGYGSLGNAFTDYDDSDFENEFGYAKADFLHNLLDYVSRRITQILPGIDSFEADQLARSIISSTEEVPLSELINCVSALLNQLKPPYSYQVGAGRLPLLFLLREFCMNPDYSHADDPENIAYYVPEGTCFAGLTTLNDYRLFKTHYAYNYRELGFDFAYLSSLRDLLIAAQSFPLKLRINRLVGAIVSNDDCSMHIPDMVDQGISPVDQFKLIFIDDYNLDFDSAESQQYLAPGVPDFFNS